MEAIARIATSGIHMYKGHHNVGGGDKPVCWMCPQASEFIRDKNIMLEQDTVLSIHISLWGGADKSLARPGRAQSTKIKFGIYTAHEAHYTW